MIGRKIVLTFAVAAMTFAGGAMANEIYKWTDEDGNVHYEDRPSGAPTEERLSFSYSRTNNSAVQSRVNARREAQATREEQRAAAAEAEKEAQDSAAAAAEQAQACEKSRARLASYLQSRRLYRTDASGERVYLDDAQQQEARKKAEEQVSKNCS